MSTRPNRRFNPFRIIVNHLKATLGAGIMVLLPIGITILVFKFIFDLLNPPLQPIFERWAPVLHIPGLGLDRQAQIPGLGFAALLVLVYLAGLIAAHVAGRRFIQIGHNIFGGIPVVKSIYGTARSAVELFSPDSKHQPYSGVVFIDFPSRGMKSIGLVTAKLGLQDGEDTLAVYVPASPIPSSGFLVVVATKDVTPTQMSVDEAMKIIVSGGILASNLYVPRSPSTVASTPDEHMVTEKAG